MAEYSERILVLKLAIDSMQKFSNTALAADYL